MRTAPSNLPFKAMQKELNKILESHGWSAGRIETTKFDHGLHVQLLKSGGSEPFDSIKEALRARVRSEDLDAATNEVVSAIGRSQFGRAKEESTEKE